MYGKKIKYFRLKAGLTLDELAEKLSCTKAAVSQYENDKRDPDDETVNKIAEVFGITWVQLTSVGSNYLKFNHFGFRKKMSVTKNEIEVLKDDIESKCKDRIDIMSILGILPEKPFQPKKLSLETSVEENAKLIRKSLGITACGPVYAITNTFETIGIIVLTFDCPDEIEGLNGTVNGIPYIFFNSNKTIERQRFTLMHEFCHLFFNHINAEGKEFEKYISNLAGNVLISNDDLYRKFGKVNRNITTYLRDYVAKEYKIAPSCLITRLHEAGVITDRYYTTFFKLLNSSLGKTHEKSLLSKTDNELPTAFTQQVYLALSKQLITASKASEVLNVPLYNVMNNMRA